MGGKVASGSPEQVGAEAIKYVFGPAKKTPTVTYPMSGQWSDDIYVTEGNGQLPLARLKIVVPV